MKSSEIKPPILLKTLLNFLFWILIFIFVSSISLSILGYFTDIPIEVNDHKINEFTSWVTFGIFLSILNSALFIYIVFLLRKLVRSFFKKKLFTVVQITGLKLIGQLIILSSLAEVVINFIKSMAGEGEARIGITIESSYGSFWFTLALGLFIILLSKSFSYAKNIQEENNLTV